MNPGDLNRKITIIKDLNRGQNNTDDNGAPIENWQPVMNPWANKKGLSGRVFYAAEAVNAETDIIFTIRYRKGITTDMRIVDDEGNTYEIKVPPLDKDGTKRFLTITASIIQAGS
jgi:SPP1 family predicted phage head-tail adaptor